MNEVPPKNSGVPKRTKRIIWGIIITAACIPVIVVLIFCAAWFWYPDKTLRDADAGFRKARNTINPEQLRAWALEQIPKYPLQTNDIFAPIIPNSEIPSYMKKIYSESVEDAIVQQGGEPCVRICWGGPFFHWMFYVGSTNFVLPNDSYVTSVEWVPGIYYSREDTRHPFK